MRYLLASAALLAASSAVSAAVIPTTLTANGLYGHDLSIMGDGVFPPDGTPYNASTSVYYGSREFAGGDDTAFTFSFGGSYNVDHVLGAVDFNDNYTVTFLNGTVATGSYTHAANSGPVTYGLQNFSAAISPIVATSAILTTSGGDDLYGVGELEFTGTPSSPAAVPEPASWALMIAGFGLVGAGLRNRSSWMVQAV